MITLLKKHYHQIAAVLISLSLSIWAVSCQPTVTSLTDPNRKVTRAEMQIELQTLQAAFEMRSTQLQQQEQIRKLILDNALILAETQTFNPIGIITSLAALYGLGSATRDTTTIVKRKLKKTPPPTA